MVKLVNICIWGCGFKTEDDLKEHYKECPSKPRTPEEQMQIPLIQYMVNRGYVKDPRG
jgi:hypothetical protein